MTALQVSWPLITATIGLVTSIIATGHAIIYKRDSRAAIAWVGLIWLVPFVGTALYVLLGINRVRRRASGLRNPYGQPRDGSANNGTYPPSGDQSAFLADDHRHLSGMIRLAGKLTRFPLLMGNRVEPLRNGDEAYPAMIDAIDGAERSVSMCTYIFDNDAVGRRFVDALARAVGRGVEVRVLVDAAGARYSMPPITNDLRRSGVPSARFMSGLLTWRTPYMNLRNHRKVLVVDGMVGFTGGINIRAGHVIADGHAHPTSDTHFRVDGPVVSQLQHVFADDWEFTTGEAIAGDRWFPAIALRDGPVAARVIRDGPDHDLDRMTMAFQGALAVAKDSVRIVTPYFLPDRALISALNMCALRGVRVDIVLPQENNLKLVAWAAMAQMWQVLEWGCRVWMTRAPFDHSKLMVVDDALSLIGSSNWDPRSLRLNFELGVECYSTDLARRLNEQIDIGLVNAHELTLREVNARTLPIKLRDGVVRLAAPYL